MATSKRTHDAEPGGKKLDSRTPMWRGVGLGQLGAIFGLITGVVSFIFLVDPALRPDPRTTQSATLTIVAVDEGVSLRAFAGRLGQGNSQAASTPEACTPGSVAYLQENLQGFKSRRTTLRFLTYDARTKTRLRGVYGSVSGGKPNIELAGEVTSDQSVVLEWVQWPYRNGSFFIRLEVFHGANLLAVVDTPKFWVTMKNYDRIKRQCHADKKRGTPPEQISFQEATVGGGGGGTDWTEVLTYIALGSASCLALVGAASLVVRLRRRGQDGAPSAGG